MPYVYPIDPTTPAPTDFAKLGDDQIRALKEAIRERLGSFFVDVDANPLVPKAGTVTSGMIALPLVLTLDGAPLALKAATAGALRQSYITFQDSVGAGRGYVGFAAAGADDVYLASLLGSIVLVAGGSGRLAVNSAGHLYPLADNAYDLGVTATNRFRHGYFAGTVTAGTYNLSTGASIQSSATYLLLQDPNGVYGIYVGGTGDPTNFYDNTTHTFRARAGGANLMSLNATRLLTNVPVLLAGSRNYQISSDGSGNLVLTDSTAALSRWQISSAGHWLASTDNTYDIGQGGANRPRNVWVAGVVIAPAFQFSGSLSFASNSGGTHGYTVLYDGSSAAAVQLGGTSDPGNYFSNTSHFFRNRAGSTVYATIDNAGLSLNSRALAIAGSRTYSLSESGGSLLLVDATAGLTRWSVTSAGHKLPGADATYDLGSGANRVRDIYSSGRTQVGRVNSDEGTQSIAAAGSYDVTGLADGVWLVVGKTTGSEYVIGLLTLNGGVAAVAAIASFGFSPLVGVATGYRLANSTGASFTAHYSHTRLR